MSNVTDINDRLRAVRDRVAKRGDFDSGDGGGDDGGMEARVAKLEAAIAHVQADVNELKGDVRGIRSDMRGDFRLLFGALIAAALGLAGLMAHGFHWL